MKTILKAIKARAIAKEAAENERIELAARRLLDERDAAARKLEMDKQVAAAEAALAALKEAAAA